MIDLSAHNGVALLRQVTTLPRLPDGLSPEQARQLPLEEAALLDLVKAFAHVLNSGDIDAVVAQYAADGVWISPRGRFNGPEEIRRNYGLYYSPVRWFTLWTNVTVRFLEPFHEAYVSAYQYSIGVQKDDPLSRGGISTDVWRVVRTPAEASDWKIAERRIDMVASHAHRMLPDALG